MCGLREGIPIVVFRQQRYDYFQRLHGRAFIILFVLRCCHLSCPVNDGVHCHAQSIKAQLEDIRVYYPSPQHATALIESIADQLMNHGPVQVFFHLVVWTTFACAGE